MKILVVSNFYPPYHIGGYELACRDIVEALCSRGHEVLVLTSSYRSRGDENESGVQRRLITSFDPARQRKGGFWSDLRLHVVAQRNFVAVVDEFKPDVVYAWNLAKLAKSLLSAIQHCGVPSAYYIFDNWLVRLVGRFGKRTLTDLALGALMLKPADRLPDLSCAQFASQYLKGNAGKCGLGCKAAKVIHWGIDADKYTCRGDRPLAGRILFAGQVVQHNGVHTAIEALGIIRAGGGAGANCTLTVAGGSVVPEYLETLKKQVSKLGLDACVTFCGHVDRTSLQNLYAEHDILLFPSTWEEPFGIVLLEAMAAELAVVGTATGGSSEILINNETGLVFRPEDAASCADRLLFLMNNPGEYNRIRKNARRVIEADFAFVRTVDLIESELTSCARARRDGRCSGNNAHNNGEKNL